MFSALFEKFIKMKDIFNVKFEYVALTRCKNTTVFHPLVEIFFTVLVNIEYYWSRYKKLIGSKLFTTMNICFAGVWIGGVVMGIERILTCQRGGQAEARGPV